VERIINYPSFRQSTDYDCGATIVQSALTYCLGSKIDKPVSDLFKDLKTTKEGGTDPEDIIRYLNSKGIKTKSGTMTQQDLINEIDKNNPTIILLQAWGDKKDYTNSKKDGHYVTVKGYNDEGFICEDPNMSMEYGFISYDSLDDRWHDVNKKGKFRDHFGIIIMCSEKFKPNKMKTIESKIVEAYLFYLQEMEWDADGEIDPQALRHTIHMLKHLAGVEKMRKVRHSLQPSLYNVYIKRSIGDYIGRTDKINSRRVDNIGVEDFEKDVEDLKKKIEFAKKIKSKLNSNIGLPAVSDDPAY
jgi:predicted double-glycine peptidase